MFESFDVRILLILLALDVGTTLIAVRLPGLGEGNPAMAWLMRHAGGAAALVATHILLAWYVITLAAEIGPYTLWAMAAVFAIVCANNLRLIARSRSR
jgi:hypothetical protein